MWWICNHRRQKRDLMFGCHPRQTRTFWRKRSLMNGHRLPEIWLLRWIIVLVSMDSISPAISVWISNRSCMTVCVCFHYYCIGYLCFEWLLNWHFTFRHMDEWGVLHGLYNHFYPIWLIWSVFMLCSWSVLYTLYEYGIWSIMGVLYTTSEYGF